MRAVLTPEQIAMGRATRTAGRRGRIEDLAELLHEHGYSLAHAAERLGVSFRTAQRYVAELKNPESY